MMAENDDIKALVRTIPDYPKRGIMFRDITTLIQNPHGFAQSVDRLAARLKQHDVSVIAGIEARGFIFGAAIARVMGLGFVLIRKKDKLPGKTIGINYALEYGSDRIEIHADSLAQGQQVALVDDLIATGGTALAAVQLLSEAGGRVPVSAFVIDLPDIGGAAKLRAAGVQVETLMAFEGD